MVSECQGAGLGCAVRKELRTRLSKSPSPLPFTHLTCLLLVLLILERIACSAQGRRKREARARQGVSCVETCLGVTRAAPDEQNREYAVLHGCASQCAPGCIPDNARGNGVKGHHEGEHEQGERLPRRSGRRYVSIAHSQPAHDGKPQRARQ